MCLFIAPRHICGHLGDHQALQCGDPSMPACRQTVVMEERSLCIYCGPIPHPQDIPQPPEPAPLAMANSRRPQLHYLNYGQAAQPFQVAIPYGGGPVQVVGPAQYGGPLYPPMPPPPPQPLPQPRQQQYQWMYYPGYGYVPVQDQPAQAAYADPAAFAPQGYPYAYQPAAAPAPAPAPVIQQAPPAPPGLPPQNLPQNLIPPHMAPRMLTIDIRPQGPNLPPLYIPIAGTNQARLTPLPPQAARENIFYINNTPFVRIVNPPPGQPIKIISAPEGTVANLPTIEQQAAEAGTLLMEPMPNFAPELNWFHIREQWMPHVSYIPLTRAEPGEGMQRNAGWNPRYGWDRGPLPPGMDGDVVVVSGEDFPFLGDDEDEGNGEGSGGGRVEVESVQVRGDEDAISPETRPQPLQGPSRPQTPPPSSSLSQSEDHILNNHTESSVNTSPTTTHTAFPFPPQLHYNTTPQTFNYAKSTLKPPTTKKEVRFIFPAREASTSQIPPNSSGSSSCSTTQNMEGLEMEGVEVGGIIYVNAQAQTLPQFQGGRRLRFEYSRGEDGEGIVEVVYADTETLNAGVDSEDGAASVVMFEDLPDVLFEDFGDDGGGKGKSKEGVEIEE